MGRVVESGIKKRSSWWWPTTFLVLFLLTEGAVYSLATVARADRWVRHTEEVRVAIGGSCRPSSTQRVRCAATSGPASRRSCRPMIAPSRNGGPSFSSSAPSPPTIPVSKSGWIGWPEPRRAPRFTRASTRRARCGHQGPELARAMLEGSARWTGSRPARGDGPGRESPGRPRQRDAIRRWRWTMVLFVGGAFGFWFVAAGGLDSTTRRRGAAPARRGGLPRPASSSASFSRNRSRDRGRRTRPGTDLRERRRRGNIGFASPAAMLAATPSEILARFKGLTVEGQPFPVEQLPGGPRSLAASRKRRSCASGFVANRRSAGPPCGRPGARSRRKGDLAINFFRDVTEEVRDKYHRAFVLRAIDELTSSLDYRRLWRR